MTRGTLKTAKRLTAAQLDNLAAIRNAGGIVENDRYGFHKPGEKTCLRGMNAVAVRSLIKLGRLTLTEGPDRDMIAVASKPEMTPSQRAALQWQRESARARAKESCPECHGEHCPHYACTVTGGTGYCDNCTGD